MTAATALTARCACGSVELAAIGRPIASAVCYCNDCQRGADQLAALPHASAVRGADGGTAYILYRKDRFRCVKGAVLLTSHKLKESSATKRVVAACCNSAMFMGFDRGPHWISAYRARFQGELPPLEMRICTTSMPRDAVLADDLPDDLPSHPGYPVNLIARLLLSRLAMLIGR
jgi:hypothetical protein